MADRMFTAHVRDASRLEPLMIERARTARHGVDLLQGDDLSAADDELVERLLANWTRLNAPLY